MARYDLTRFRSTHNSYSGGGRGSLPEQLDRGIRCLELDFHDNGYEEIGDYRVGHLKPGSEVARGGGNPNTFLLRDWLGTIAAWSDAHPGHAPIALVLDSKDDLTDNENGGDLDDLNETLEGALGPKLFTRDDYDAQQLWPGLDGLQDRLLCVLSGAGATRAAYRWAFGSAPALAVNADGTIVLVYRSTAGDLNCWTGTLKGAPPGAAWRRKVTYGLGDLGLSQPAVALNDDGWLVAVDRFKPAGFQGPLLESRLGRIREDQRIQWFASEVFAQGSAPSLQIDGDEVREIHTTWDGEKRQQVLGSINRQRRKIEWRKPRPTQAEPFPRNVADWQGERIRCGVASGGVIGWGAGSRALEPVRFRQVLFVEEQKGDDPDSIRDALFYAADAKDQAAVASGRNRGLVGRAWGFEEADQTQPPTPPQENMPATDSPQAPWFRRYMTGPDVAD
jgi:hypothetical protein